MSAQPPGVTAPPRRRSPQALRLSIAAVLGVLAATLVSCGSGGKSLIPVAHAGPLLSDFEAVRQAAESASGNCSATEAALAKTEEDFTALPPTVDAGLRNNLRQGLTNLRVRAHELCAQPVVQPTVSTTAPKTTTTTPTTPTQTTPTQSTPTTPTQTTPTTPTQTSTGPEGGTPAPGAGETPPAAPGGGTGAGEAGGKAPDTGAGAGGAGSGQGQGGETGK